MKRKLLACILTSALILTAFTGCNLNSDSKKSDSKSSDTKSSVSDNTSKVNDSKVSDSEDGNTYTREELLAMPEPTNEGNIDNFPDALFEYEETTGGMKITGYRVDPKAGTVLIVPSKAEGKPVVEIGENAFSGKDIKYVVIPESVTLVDEKAFIGCKQLNAVYVKGESLKRVENAAFELCDKLSKVELPASLEYIHPTALNSLCVANELVISAPSGSCAEKFVNDNADKLRKNNLANLRFESK